MSKKRSPGSGANAPDVLAVHAAQFVAALAPLGYAKKTQHDKRRAIAPFVRWVRTARIALAALDEACVGTFLRCRSNRHRKRRERAALYHFLRYLRGVGAVPQRHAKHSPAGLLVQRYLDHLRENRGLSVRSLQIYSPIVHSFVEAQRLPKRLTAIDATSVRRYLLDHSRNRSVPCVKLLRAALRSFLRFCFLDGMTWTDLSNALPPVRRWQHAPLPPLLTTKEIKRVIATADRSTPRGCRAFAILLLLARLGLRAGEIVALELDDIRWDVGELLVRGKGQQHDRLPLPKDVGKALAAYLRNARGTSTSRRVFLRSIAPHVELSGPTAVCVVAREALRRAELRPSGRVGAHIFRHSLASQMIRNGASFAEISQVLRHRSLHTTQLYARVELEALRSVALPWPKTEVRR
jgi:integrase/recombinase XerD